MMVSIVSAFLIMSTYTFITINHLTCFAMWPAFPTPDYYQVSVAMGLAPLRRSRISPMSYVRA